MLFLFLTYHQIYKLNKPLNEYHLAQGIIENKGLTQRISHPKSRKSFKTTSEVMFVKLKNNDTIYSYFNRDKNELVAKINHLKINDYVSIYNEGFDLTLNTVKIIELQNNSEPIISRDIFNSNKKILIILFIVCFLVSLIFPILRLRKK